MKLAPKENRVLREQLEHKAQPAPLDQRVPLVRLALTDREALRALQEQRVLRG